MTNPYSSPVTDAKSSGGSDAITPGVIRALAGTRPWVRLCSVIGFISIGFMLLAALAMLAGGGAAMLNGDSGAMPFTGFPVIIGVAYLVMAALYFYPAIKLWKYGSHIVTLMSSNSVTDLEAALDCQRSFWKFVGIMVIIMIVFYVGIGLFAGLAAFFTVRETVTVP